MDTTTTSTGMKPRHSSNQDSDEIMADIAETRAQMDQTIDELSERLQPRHLIDDVLDYFRTRRSSGSGEGKQRVRRVANKAKGQMSKAAGQVKEKAGVAGRAAYSQVKQHPLPTLLIGAGISLLLMQRNRSDEYHEDYDDDGYVTDNYDTGYGEFEGSEASAPESYALPQHYSEDGSGDESSGFTAKMKDKAAQLKGKAAQLKEKGAELTHKAGSSMQNMKERTMERASALRMRASEKGSEWKERAVEKAHYGYETSRDAFSRATHEQPLALGLGFLAIGVLAGMLIPSTRKEDELVGPARDRIVNRTREAAQDAVNRGKHVAKKAVEVAKQQAQEQGLTPGALAEKAQAVASQVKEVAREDVQRQQQEFTAQVKQS